MAVDIQLKLIDEMTSPLLKITASLARLTADLKEAGALSSKAFDGVKGDLLSVNAEIAKVSAGAVEGGTKAAESAKEAGAAARTAGEEAAGAGAKAKGFMSSTVGFFKSMAGFAVVQKAWDGIKGSIEAANTATEQATKLQTVMASRGMGGQKNFNSVQNTITQESMTGVVGKGAQLAGAQQFATFVHSAKSIKTVLPALNDLAVQQNGANVSGEKMVGIANLAGKVFTGQVGALKKVGITFTDAQERMMKSGTEAQKAATLAKVIKENVGDMNQKIAQTPAGSMAQLKNQMTGLQVLLGQALIPGLGQAGASLAKVLPSLKNFFTALGTVLGGAVEGFAKVVRWGAKLISVFGGHKLNANGVKDLRNTVAALTPAILGAVAAFKIFKTVTDNIEIFKKIGGFLADMNPTRLAIMLIVVALILVLTHIKQIKAWVAKVKAAFGGWLNSVKQRLAAFKASWVAAWSGMKAIFHVVIASCKAFFAAFINGIKILIRGYLTFWKTIWNAIRTVVSTVVNKVVSLVKGMFNRVKSAASDIKDAIKGVFTGLLNAVQHPIQTIKGWLGDIADKAKSIISAVSSASSATSGGKSGHNATGTRSWSGGWTWVGERGAELVNLPRGSSIMTHRDSIAATSGRSVAINKLADTFVVREDADIDRIANAVVNRLIAASDNTVPV